MTKTELLAIAQPVAKRIWKKLRKHYSQLPSDCPKVKICGRMHKNLAYARFDLWEIQLSGRYLRINLDTYLSDIIPHELAHIADDCINGEVTRKKDWHGDNWRIIMHKLRLPAVEAYAIIEE